MSALPPAFDSEKAGEIVAAIEEAIDERKLPGAVYWLERKGDVFTATIGQRALEPEPEMMTSDTVFDAASLTKVMATTPAIMLLAERGEIDLEEPVARYIPDFAQEGKEEVTVRQLLTHTSGLRAGIGQNPPWQGYEEAIDLACREKLQSQPGTAFRYSDINFILLGELVRRVGGLPLEDFVRRELYEPLEMTDTGYLPDESMRPRIAPTERTREGMLRGVVHDPTARAMGGVAGHAGIFTTARDLSRYARMLLNEGKLDGVQIFEPETVRLMTSVQTPETVEVRRGFGWDIDSPYSRPRGGVFPLGSFGHTGWTGTSLWIDPHSGTFWLLLSNRVHPDGKGNVLALQRALGTLSAEAARDFDFSDVPGALPARTTGENGE